MATYKSKAYRDGVPFRPLADQPFSLTASILVPSGTAIVANDIFRFMKVGANVRLLDVTFTTTDLDTAAAIVFDVGYSAAVAADAPAAFINDTTIGQAGGISTVGNGGTPAFAVGGLAPIAETIDIEAVCTVSPTGNPATDRYLTVTVRGIGMPTTASQTPYVYADRYDATGVGTV